MKTALIGHTGFVGANLKKHYHFTELYHSKNIHEIESQNFDLVVCAGIPADMGQANKFPEKDFEQVAQLIKTLKTITTQQFVLISTIAVYAQPCLNVNEISLKNAYEHTIPYGVNRLWAERELSAHFKSLIIRLPALFGQGLKKNLIYDLLNLEPAMLSPEAYIKITNQANVLDRALIERYYSFESPRHIYYFDKHQASLDQQRDKLKGVFEQHNFTSLQFTHPESSFQFYNLEYLWQDIQIALNHNISLLNIASEPIQAKTIVFDLAQFELPLTNSKVYQYDMRSVYAQRWQEGTKEGYLYSKKTIMQDLKTFFMGQSS